MGANVMVCKLQTGRFLENIAFARRLVCSFDFRVHKAVVFSVQFLWFPWWLFAAFCCRWFGYAQCCIRSRLLTAMREARLNLAVRACTAGSSPLFLLVFKSVPVADSSHLCAAVDIA